MKKNLILILMVILAFSLVIPVAAKGPGTVGNGPDVPVSGQGTKTASAYAQKSPRQTFALVGTIESINPDLKTLDIKVINGNKLVHESKGNLVTVVTVDGTRYLRKIGTTSVPISFEDLCEGDKVSVNGIYVNDTWKAYRITVGAYLSQSNK